MEIGFGPRKREGSTSEAGLDCGTGNREEGELSWDENGKAARVRTGQTKNRTSLGSTSTQPSLSRWPRNESNQGAVVGMWNRESGG